MRWTTEGCKIIWGTEILLLNDAQFKQSRFYWQNGCWFGNQACLLLYVGHTKEGTKGILGPKKVPEHLIWAAECEGEFWEIWRKFWAGGACGAREWQEKNEMDGERWERWSHRWIKWDKSSLWIVLDNITPEQVFYLRFAVCHFRICRKPHVYSLKRELNEI